MLYLVQHGEAATEAEDPARPLTERGQQGVARVARTVARFGLEVAIVAHSGKLRARQTAGLLAATLRPTPAVVEQAGLGPNDDPQDARRLAEQATVPTMLVGHLPHLSRLASLLLVGDPATEVVAFHMGGIVCLSRQEGRWRLAWALTPEVAVE